jgi:hypothetical protein
LWPSHPVCIIHNFDFSESFRSETHSFTGTASQKSEAKTIHIYFSPQIDFIPVEVFSKFLNINGLFLYASNLPATLKSELFTKDFEKIEYLEIYSCKVQAIEESAFKYLVNLKWIRLRQNQIKSLPYQFFKASPNLIYIGINSNKINSINPALFKGLSNLKFIESEGNQCTNKNLGCETCSISQSDLDSEFSTCFSNCLRNQENCAIKSGGIDKLSHDEIKNNLGALISNGQTDVLLRIIFEQINDFKTDSQKLQANFSSELEYQKNVDKNLNETIENLQEIVNEAKNSCESQVENSKKYSKARQVEFENQLKIFSEQFNRSVGKFEEDTKKTIGEFEQSFKERIIENTTKALSANLEKTEGRLEKIVENLSLKFSEIKALMEVERMQWKLKEAEHTIESERFKNEKLEMELQMEKMRKEFAEKLETRAALKIELEEIMNNKIDALKNEFRP